MRSNQPALVVDGSLSVAADVTLPHGDTGSGKSTLLRVIAGRLAAAGRLTLAGVRLENDPVAYRHQVFWCDPTTDAFDQVTAATALQRCTRAMPVSTPSAGKHSLKVSH